MLTGEIWNPDTQTWRSTADMSVPRNYHSVALLLVDGRVLSAGGGLCGGCNANHPDAQVYSPPYLFNPDGTLDTPGDYSFSGCHQERSNVQRLGYSRYSALHDEQASSTTHAVNTDQRFLNVDFEDTGSGEYQLSAHGNVNVLTPGYYFLFALNAQGVPSIAEIVQLDAGVAPSNYPPSVVQLKEQFSRLGNPASIGVVAMDIDGDPVSFSAVGLPAGLSIDSDSGEIAGVATIAGSRLWLFLEVTITAPWQACHLTGM